jgi:hypothetical protein
MPEDRPAESPATTPDPRRVAERAYELYLSRGGEDGRDMDDWFVAEQELIRNQKPGDRSS